MQRIIQFLILTAFILMFFGCSAKQPNPQTSTPAREFKLPEIPLMLTDSTEIRAFLAMHYWDNYNFADTTISQQISYTEEAFINYIILLQKTSNNIATKSIQKLMQKAQADSGVFAYFMGLSERYFYDPTSPFRNDEFYIPALEVIMSSNLLSASQKIRPAFQLNMARKNRVGTKATDLNFILRNGENKRMYECMAFYTLLIFYNPDCHTCHETIIKMKNSKLLSELIQNKSLKTIAIYTDSDKKAWLKYHSNIPEMWINGWLNGLNTKQAEKYDLKASPTLYLLAKDKTVILKDAQIEQVLDYLKAKN